MEEQSELSFCNEVMSADILKSAFTSFLAQPQAYKNDYLQKNVKSVFDGYSYLGQEDSLNQYSSDWLHSFVLSDLTTIDSFPREFHFFLKQQFTQIKAFKTTIDLALANHYGLQVVADLYKNDEVAFMISCNYYPPANDSKELQELLSAHVDVSLFTTFPFGISEGLVVNGIDGTEMSLGKQDMAFSFKGYGAELLSDNEVKATNHYVKVSPHATSERFSFAVFSIPKPSAILKLKSGLLTGDQYYKKYLSLF